MNGAERLLKVMAKMMEQVQETTDIVYGVVADTWPLRINIGDIQIDERFIIAEPEVLITMYRGEEVRMLRTNHGQKFYILKIVEVNGSVDLSYIVWIPNVSDNGDITWSRVEAKTTPNVVTIQGPPGRRGEKGEVGDQGPTGLEGYKGEKGETGNQGLPGPTGERGPKGEKGTDGYDGPQGDKGDQGQKGQTGDRGPGLPAGGVEGQVPVKSGTEDYSFQWQAYGGGDMRYENYDPDQSVKAHGSLNSWLFVTVPFVNDIKNIPDDGSLPTPITNEGDILLIHSPV